YQEQLNQRERDLLSAFSLFREPMPLEAVGSVMGFSTDTRSFFKNHLPVLNALRHRYLLQDSGSLRYQLHPIVSHYAYDHFFEQTRETNSLKLFEAHVNAAEYYQQRAKNASPPRTQRTSLLDLHDF